MTGRVENGEKGNLRGADPESHVDFVFLSNTKIEAMVTWQTNRSTEQKVAKEISAFPTEALDDIPQWHTRTHEL